jgi:hypothetical protein
MTAKRKSRSDEIDWDNLDPDEPLTITLLRPSLATLIKNCEKIRRRNSKQSRRRKSHSAHEA